jgi:hypothetical protein
VTEWLSVLGHPAPPKPKPAHSEGVMEVYGANNRAQHQKIAVMLRTVAEAVRLCEAEHAAGTLSSVEVKELMEAAAALSELEGSGQIVPAGMSPALAKQFL